MWDFSLPEKAYATLKSEYALDQTTITANELSTVPPGAVENKPPVVTLEGDSRRTIKVGQPLNLSAFVIDDGIFKPAAAPPFFPGAEPGFNPARGLRVAWFVYRGAGKVTFEPEQFKVYMDVKGNSPWAAGWTPPPLPADGKHPVRVTFRAPGTFVIRVLAHDGGLRAYQDVTIIVTP